MPFAGPKIVLQDEDILIVAQKIVSKAEGRIVDLSTIVPSPAALKCAQMVNKDARHVEVVLRESEEILKLAPNALITVHRLGFVMANAGVDQSNVDHAGGGGTTSSCCCPKIPMAARRP